MKLFLADESATIELGRRVLLQLPEDLAGWTLLLSGELGAGKSTFARALNPAKAAMDFSRPSRERRSALRDCRAVRCWKSWVSSNCIRRTSANWKTSVQKFTQRYLRAHGQADLIHPMD